MAGKQSPFKKVTELKAKESPFAKVMRNRRTRGVDWSRVDYEMLRYAAASVVMANATLVLSSAMGGIGATIRVWAGDDKWVEYASSADELNECLEMVGDYYAPQSEDLRVVLGMVGGGEPEELASQE